MLKYESKQFDRIHIKNTEEPIRPSNCSILCNGAGFFHKGLIIGNNSSITPGAIRYRENQLEYCDDTSWRIISSTMGSSKSSSSSSSSFSSSLYDSGLYTDTIHYYKVEDQVQLVGTHEQTIQQNVTILLQDVPYATDISSPTGIVTLIPNDSIKDVSITGKDTNISITIQLSNVENKVYKVQLHISYLIS